MTDLNPAVSNDPFPDWPFGVSGDRDVIALDEWVRVPLNVAECPTCHFMLEATPMQVMREHGVGEIQSIDLRCRMWYDNDQEGHWRHHIMGAHCCDRVIHRVTDWMQETYQVPPDDHTVTDSMKQVLFDRETE